MVGIRSFPFGTRPIFRGYVSFREGKICCHLFFLYLEAIFPIYFPQGARKNFSVSPSHHTLSRYRSSQSCEHGEPCINHGSVEEMAKYLKGNYYWRYIPIFHGKTMIIMGPVAFKMGLGKVDRHGWASYFTQ